MQTDLSISNHGHDTDLTGELIEPTPDRSVSTKELLDEDDHLVLLDGTGVVLVEGLEDLIESLLGELVTGSEVSKGVLDELLGLFLVEGTGLVDIISVPDLVDDTLDGLLFRS